MSTTQGLSPAPAPAPSSAPTIGSVPVVSRKAPIILGLLTVALGLILVLAAQTGETTYRLAAASDFVELPELTVPTMATAWVLAVVCALLAAESIRRLVARRRTPGWVLAVFAVVWILGFLTWAAAGETLPVVGLLAGSIALSVPLVFGALGGVLGERAGVVNIAIDGQLPVSYTHLTLPTKRIV